MEAGRCPECGGMVTDHSSDSRFWIPRNCDLTFAGVSDRIDQYKADLFAGSEQ